MVAAVWLDIHARLNDVAKIQCFYPQLSLTNTALQKIGSVMKEEVRPVTFHELLC
jgi:hypothetical protein